MNMSTYQTSSALVTYSQDIPCAEAWRVFSTNNAEWCTTANYNNSWVGVTLPTAVIANTCTLVGRSVATGNNFSAWVLEASNSVINDNTSAAAATYTLLYTSNNQSFIGAANITYTVSFSNTTAYTTYRFRSTAGVANPGLKTLNFIQNANLKSNRIINVADPQLSQDVATRIM